MSSTEVGDMGFSFLRALRSVAGAASGGCERGPFLRLYPALPPATSKQSFRGMGKDHPQGGCRPEGIPVRRGSVPDHWMRTLYRPRERIPRPFFAGAAERAREEETGDATKRTVSPGVDRPRWRADLEPDHNPLI